MRVSLPQAGMHVLRVKNGVRPGKRQMLLLASGVLWLGVVGAGLGVLWGFENRPGVAAHPPAQWPSSSRLEPATDRPTLVMLAHPRCSCTRASIGELAVLMAQASLRPQAYVLFLKPAQFAHDWEKSSLWHSAAAIPNVTVVRDDDGLEAHRFGAATSGQTMRSTTSTGGYSLAVASPAHADTPETTPGGRRFWLYYTVKPPDATAL